MGSEGGASVADLMRLLLEDRQRREEEMAAAMQQREQQAELEKEQMREQMEVLRRLVEASQHREGAHVPRTSSEHEAKLAPQLTGKAQQAYAAMSSTDAGDYEALKAAILRRYDINQEAYRQRFRTATKKEEETVAELATRLRDLLGKWRVAQQLT